MDLVIIIGVFHKELPLNVPAEIRINEKHFCLLLLAFMGSNEKRISGDHVVAYAYLAALMSQSPRIVGRHVPFILNACSEILVKEKPRILKQKGIYSSQIAETLSG